MVNQNRQNSNLWTRKRYKDDFRKRYNRRNIENELDMFFHDLIEPILEIDVSDSESQSDIPRGILLSEGSDDASSVGNFSLDEQSYSHTKSQLPSPFTRTTRKFISRNRNILRDDQLITYDEHTGSKYSGSSHGTEEESSLATSKYFSVASSSGHGLSRDSESMSGTSFYTTGNSTILSLKARKRSIERSIARYPDYCNA